MYLSNQGSRLKVLLENTKTAIGSTCFQRLLPHNNNNNNFLYLRLALIASSRANLSQPKLKYKML